MLYPFYCFGCPIEKIVSNILTLTSNVPFTRLPTHTPQENRRAMQWGQTEFEEEEDERPEFTHTSMR